MQYVLRLTLSFLNKIKMKPRPKVEQIYLLQRNLDNLMIEKYERYERYE